MSPDQTQSSLQGCHMFHQRDEEPSGNFEVYWVDQDVDDEDLYVTPGWYWIALAGDDPRGPFPSSRDAFVDAQWSAQ